jgi:hypothetical protein
MSEFEWLQRRLDAREATLMVSEEEMRQLETDMDRVVKTIRTAATPEETEVSLAALAHLQELLATIAFKHGVSLSPRLRQLVRKFDRPDDSDLRAHTHELIRRGEFP